MLTKLVLLLFCGALINAKSLVQRDPRLQVVEKKEFEHVKLTDVFTDFMQGLENVELGPSEFVKVGANPQGKFDNSESEKSLNEVIDEDSDSDQEEENVAPELNKDDKQEEEKLKSDNDAVDEEDEEEEEDSDDQDGNALENNEEETNKKVEEEDDEEESEEEVDGENKEETETNNETGIKEEAENEQKKEQNNEEESEEDDSESEEEVDVPSNPKTSFANAPKSQLLGTSRGSENLYQDSFKLAKSFIDSLISASQNPKTKKLANSVANFLDLKSLTKNVNLESLMKNILPLKKSSPKHTDNEEKDLFNLDQDSLMKQIQTWENENKMEQSDSDDRVFDLDDPSIGSFIPQSFPTNLEDWQKNFQGLTNFWKKTPANVDLKQSVQKEPKVGFGGWNSQQKLIFGDLTKYVNKAVNQAQAQLEEKGSSIEAHNPPLTINVIPGLPIIFNLKRVEGANTLDTYGQSKGIHYNKLYAFTQYKFTELRYYYDVIIKPLNLFAIRKSITIILNEAPTKMSVTVENNNQMKILGMEFVNPQVSLDVGSHRYVNYGINYLLNEYLHPVVRQKLVEIVSRDSKLLLTKYLQEAQ